jgi:hypothetical protein
MENTETDLLLNTSTDAECLGETTVKMEKPGDPVDIMEDELLQEEASPVVQDSKAEIQEDSVYKRMNKWTQQQRQNMLQRRRQMIRQRFMTVPHIKGVKDFANIALTIENLAREWKIDLPADASGPEFGEVIIPLQKLNESVDLFLKVLVENEISDVTFRFYNNRTNVHLIMRYRYRPRTTKFGYELANIKSEIQNTGRRELHLLKIKTYIKRIGRINGRNYANSHPEL